MHRRPTMTQSLRPTHADWFSHWFCVQLMHLAHLHARSTSNEQKTKFMVWLKASINRSLRVRFEGARGKGEFDGSRLPNRWWKNVANCFGYVTYVICSSTLQYGSHRLSEPKRIKNIVEQKKGMPPPPQKKKAGETKPGGPKFFEGPEATLRWTSFGTPCFLSECS